MERSPLTARLSAVWVVLPLLLLAVGGFDAPTGFLAAVTAVAAVCVVGLAAVRAGSLSLALSVVRHRDDTRSDPAPSRQHDPAAAGHPRPRAPGAPPLP